MALRFSFARMSTLVGNFALFQIAAIWQIPVAEVINYASDILQELISSPFYTCNRLHSHLTCDSIVNILSTLTDCL